MYTFDEGVAEDRLLERWFSRSRFLTEREKHRRSDRLPKYFGRFKQEAGAVPIILRPCKMMGASFAFRKTSLIIFLLRRPWRKLLFRETSPLQLNTQIKTPLLPFLKMHQLRKHRFLEAVALVRG